MSSLELSAHTATQMMLCCEPGCPDYAKNGFSRCPTHLLQRRPAHRPPMRLELVGEVPDEYWLTLEECAASVRVSPASVWRWIRADQLAALVLTNRVIRVRSEDWIVFVRSRMTGG